jgi:hypothetical protein
MFCVARTGTSISFCVTFCFFFPPVFFFGLHSVSNVCDGLLAQFMTESERKEPTDAEFGPHLEYERDKSARGPTLILWYAEYCGACINFRENHLAETTSLAADVGVTMRGCNTDTHPESMMKLVVLNGNANLFVPLFVWLNAPGHERPLMYKGLAKPHDIVAWLRTLVPTSATSGSSSGRRAAVSKAREVTVAASLPSKGSDTKEKKAEARRAGKPEAAAKVANVGVTRAYEKKKVAASIREFHDRDSLNAFLRRHDRGTVVLQWYLPMCGACEGLGRHMTAWHEQYASPTLTFARADAADITDAPWQEYPVTQIVRSGKVAETIRGYRPAAVEVQLQPTSGI